MSLTIDDSDSRVQYSPPSAWQTAGNPQEYDSTTHFASQNGATATLVFTGNGVAVYGTIASLENTQAGGGPPLANFSVDGSSPVTYTPVPISGQIQYRQQFYNSPQLQNQQHTLVVTKYLDSSEFWLDYFIVHGSSSSSTSIAIPPAATAATAPQSSPSSTSGKGASSTINSSSSSSSPSSSSLSSPSSAGTSASTSTSSNRSTSIGSTHLSTSSGVFVSSAGSVSTTTSSVAQDGNSPSSAGVIVGGVLGALILILAIIIILLLRRRKNRTPPGPPNIVPFSAGGRNYESLQPSPATMNSPTQLTADGIVSARRTTQWLPARKPPLGSPNATTNGYGWGENQYLNNVHPSHDAPPMYSV